VHEPGTGKELTSNLRHPAHLIEETTVAIESLDDLFLNELKDIYDAEKRLLKALPKMAKAAGDAELEKSFLAHTKETQKQVGRLERVFKQLKKPVRGKSCAAMQGLIAEGEKLMKEKGDTAVVDAGLICAAQKVEHYEIAAYGTLVAWGRRLGRKGIVELLETTLAEEKATDEKLTALSETLNLDAAEAEE
jgi:ferritin-like metal-binding protein YciE